MSRNKMKLGILVYKTGKSFTKGESRLQNRNPIYKKGTLRYKRDSRITIYHRIFDLLFTNRSYNQK